jgi:RNA polymerase sigma-70 factor, ECF subfamily
MADSDAGRLLTAAQAGDPHALEALLGAHRDTVFRYGLRFCRSTEDTEDAVQETLFAAARYIGTFRRAAAFTTWLFAIVRNKCHRMLGSHRHEEADLADALPQWAGRSAEDEAINAEVRRMLAAALARIEPAHRQVLLLRDVEGFTAPEAAARLEITVQALKSRLHRAREALRAELAGGDRETPPELHG